MVKRNTCIVISRLESCSIISFLKKKKKTCEYFLSCGNSVLGRNFYGQTLYPFLLVKIIITPNIFHISEIYQILLPSSDWYKTKEYLLYLSFTTKTNPQSCFCTRLCINSLPELVWVSLGNQLIPQVWISLGPLLGLIISADRRFISKICVLSLDLSSWTYIFSKLSHVYIWKALRHIKLSLSLSCLPPN